jgi:hypothetical protein
MNREFDITLPPSPLGPDFYNVKKHHEQKKSFIKTSSSFNPPSPLSPQTGGVE